MDWLARASRLGWIPVLLGALWLLSACDPAPVLDLTVNSTVDAPDATPGDGLCETAVPDQCTLRAAVMEANAQDGHDVIRLDGASTYTLTIPGTADVEDEAGDLNITDYTSIRAEGATIDADGIDRVLAVEVGAKGRIYEATLTGGSKNNGGAILNRGDLKVVDSTITQNMATGWAGGVLNSTTGTLLLDRTSVSDNASHLGGGIYTFGSVNLKASTVADNVATYSGGGIRVDGGGSLSATASTISGNSAVNVGGGIWSSGTLGMTNSTISGNTGLVGGGIATSGPVQLVYATVTDNAATRGAGDGGGIAWDTSTAAGGSVTVTASIITDNTNGDCDTSLTSAGWNLDGDASCLGAPASGDLPGADAQLGSLADEGGPTRTHMPAPGSDAVDRIPLATAVVCDGFVKADQRGVSRHQGTACDVGAVERDFAIDADFVVDTAADASDAAPGNGVCDIGNGTCSLRAAIDEANADPSLTEVAIEPGIDPILAQFQSGGGSEESEDANVTGDLDIHGDLVIDGWGADIKPLGNDRVLHNHAGHLQLDDLTITGGDPHPGSDECEALEVEFGHVPGGGVLTLDDLTLERVTVTGNNAAACLMGPQGPGVDSVLPGAGGGIYVGGGTTTLVDSTVSDNRAEDGGVFGDGLSSVFPGAGGGVYGGPLIIQRSTISGNTAENRQDDEETESRGGGIHLAGTAATITNSTIADNTASGTVPLAEGAGGAIYGGTVSLRASTIAGNVGSLGTLHSVSLNSSGSILQSSGSPVCGATTAASQWSILSDTSCALPAGGGNEQGANALLGPLAFNGGPTKTMVPDAGSTAIDQYDPPGTACTAGITVDQRGYARTGPCDSGSVETGAVPPVCTTQAQVPASECEALVSLHAATATSGWIIATGWGTSPTPCSWHGVTCAGGHVAEVRLPGNNLVGSLPANLDALSHLEVLDLNGNELVGTIPENLASIGTLRQLNLGANAFSGLLPDWLGSVGSLEVLDLSGNSFSGAIPLAIGDLTALESLGLANNDLTGSIPANLGDLVSLTSLDLSGNALVGDIPATFLSLVALQDLALYPNGCLTDGGNPTLGPFLTGLDSEWQDGCRLLTTIAGTTHSGNGDGGPASGAKLDARGVAVDGSGNIFVADWAGHRVRRVDAATGVVTTVAGTGVQGFNGDGQPAVTARLRNPTDVAITADGDLLIADRNNSRVRRVDIASGMISTIAGTGAGGSGGYNGDGILATTANVSAPDAITLDADGNLYIGDTSQRRVRRVDVATGIISTVAGTGGSGYNGDGQLATAATISWPGGVAVDSEGQVYIADLLDHRVRRVDPSTGLISTVAGTGASGYNGDAIPAATAQLTEANDVVVDASDHLFIADAARIRRVDAVSQVITTYAGTGVPGFGVDGQPAVDTRLTATALTFDGTGQLVVSDGEADLVRRINASDTVVATVVGSCCGPTFNGDNQPSTDAWLAGPTAVEVDAAGNYYIADTGNHRVRRVDAVTGTITTVAGTGAGGFAGDGGPATEADLRSPSGLVLDDVGNLYISDTENHRVRRVDGATGIITTVVGDGLDGYDGDNQPATNASLSAPHGLAVGPDGDLFIADREDHRLRRVDAGSGLISTAAGTGASGYNGDHIPAVAANLSLPRDVAVDEAGNVFVAQEGGGGRVRRIDAASGLITTVVDLEGPAAVALGGPGVLYVADRDGNRVHLVDIGTGDATVIAGVGIPGFNGDLLATQARVNEPSGIAVDAAGNVYIADTGNDRIRLVS